MSPYARWKRCADLKSLAHTTKSSNVAQKVNVLCMIRTTSIARLALVNFALRYYSSTYAGSKTGAGGLISALTYFKKISGGCTSDTSYCAKPRYHDVLLIVQYLSIP